MTDLSIKLQAHIDAMLTQKRETILPEPAVEEVADGDTVQMSDNLPDVSESKRAVPTAILRSSLSGVVGKGHRKYERNVLKATVKGLTVKFTGEAGEQRSYVHCKASQSWLFYAYDRIRKRVLAHVMYCGQVMR